MRKKRPLRAKKGRVRSRKRLLCTGISAAVLLLLCYTGGILHSMVAAYAVSDAKTILSDTANQAVYRILQEEGVSYEDLVQLRGGQDSTVSALEVNTVLVNRLKTRLSTEISALLRDRERMRLQVPLGSLFNSELFWGRGPEIPFNLDITGTVLTDFNSGFHTAGINQTLHQISVTVSAQAYVVMPLYRKRCEVDTSFLVAQTVIVGAVPDAYTYVFDDDREDIVGDLFDYGAAAE